MTFPTFPEFFRALNGVDPYLWQEEAARRLALGLPLTDVLVPTGTGKTAVMDAWLWAYADQRHRGQARSVPTRLHFLVDRRDLVGDNAARARRLRDRLRSAHSDRSDPALAAVADVLAEVDPELLDVRELRGGLPVRAEHTANPARPAIVSATVDLFGSRLLWRGYGVSRARRPIDAALTGIDTLVVLDEVHISSQLNRTLEVLELQNAPGSQLVESATSGVPRRTVVRMTATPDSTSAAPLEFDLDAETARSPRLREMVVNRAALALTASNPWLDSLKPTPKNIATQLTDAARRAPGPAVLVMCNTVAVAVATHNLLKKDGVVVIHGRMPRPVRERALEVMEDLRPGRPRRNERRYVVATSALEVGADLDFDSLVTQCSSIDSLRQRVGRVNRLGLRASGDVHVLSSPQDAVHKGAAVEVFTALAPHASWGAFSDALPADLTPLRIPPVPVTTLDAPAFRDYLRTQGTLGEAPVAGWLRPEERTVPVSVVFRDDLHRLPPGSAWAQYVRTVRPVAGEAWTLPLAEVRDLLEKAAKASGRNTAPTSLVHVAPDTDLWVDQPDILTLTTESPGVLRPGSTVLLPSGTLPAPYEEFGKDCSRHPAVNTLPAELVTDASLESALEGTPTSGRRVVLADDAGTPVGCLQIAQDPVELETPRRQELAVHGAEVGTLARRWADALGMAPELAHTVELAARYHDLGKLLPANQELLSTSEVAGELVVVPSDQPLAKSDLPHAARRAAARAAQLPQGFRHEALSAVLVSALVTSGAVEVEDHELLRHLVGAHHGHGRGLMPVADQADQTHDYVVEKTSITTNNPLQAPGLEWAQWSTQFESLNARYGPYTLALLESVVRLADWSASEDLL